MNIRRIFVVACFVFQYVFSQHEYANELFNIEIPAGWIVMSNETANFLHHELNYKTRFTVRLKYNYILQQKSGDTLFSFPSFFIQRNASGRLTMNELQSFNSSIFTLDQRTHYLWGFRDTVIEVFIPTEEGTMNVFCYSSKSDLLKNKEQYSRLINSIIIDPALSYKENTIRDIPFVGNVLYGRIYRERVITILTFSVILGFIVRKKRNRAEGIKP